MLCASGGAATNAGGNWRMPPKEEWDELYNNTTVTWTQQNGVNGRLFTAANGNSLFLPAAGWRYGSNLDVAGSNGYYWSSLINSDDPLKAWILFYYSGNYGTGNGSSRYCGLTVRPVRSAE